jgi:hypothetical protein
MNTAPDLAEDVLEVLMPHLSALVGAGQDGNGSRDGSGKGTPQARALWAMLRPRIQSDPIGREIEEELAADPTDSVLHTMLVSCLRGSV